jgi:hypothetical protein
MIAFSNRILLENLSYRCFQLLNVSRDSEFLTPPAADLEKSGRRYDDEQ